MNPFFVICHYIQYISSRNLPTLGTEITICLASYMNRSDRFYCIFDGLCASQKFLSLPTNTFMYLIKPRSFFQFSEDLHYRMTEFCADFYIGINLFIILNSFIIYFYDSGQLLALLKLLWDKKKTMQWWRFVFIQFERYGIKLFKSVIVEIVQRIIAKIHITYWTALVNYLTI